ncbi:dipeptide epimerase [Pseudoalteromonas shioyasakiensis]|uniref:mandelate racemase/muconate lactonizing enzyme family protein n=1 Tax=Pseudoalteromonas shioyasakiensis TaxID=1190813 RepID=UPI0021199602|nr:dipeptide epimerase [Pseudoalteromonas shioyasakiensis]MCQ8876975.1 dipeptide epimerase [Pseudoalteromonas shioyasakiensis]
MVISKIEIGTLNVPFTGALKTPVGILSAANNVVVKIVSSDGEYGWGEASPMAQITGDSQQSNYEMAKLFAKHLLGKNPLALDTRIAEINYLTVGDPSIRCAFDMALYDLAAKVAKMPLYQYLGGEPRELRTNLTVGIQDTVEETLALAKSIFDSGFNAIKLKVGRSGLQDIPHVKAVRELAGPDISIKVDSNQGWDYPTAVKNIVALCEFNIDYYEQPIAAWDYDGLKRLRNATNQPICADESLFNHKDAFKLLKAEAVDILNIKLGKSGGIHSALKINSIAESAGVKCMIGCFGESRLGLSAAAHLATARPNIHYLDLDSAFHFKSDPVSGGLQYDKSIGGLIHLNADYGHGASVDEKAIEQVWSLSL